MSPNCAGTALRMLCKRHPQSMCGVLPRTCGTRILPICDRTACKEMTFCGPPNEITTWHVEARTDAFCRPPRRVVAVCRADSDLRKSEGILPDRLAQLYCGHQMTPRGCIAELSVYLADGTVASVWNRRPMVTKSVTASTAANAVLPYWL